LLEIFKIYFKLTGLKIQNLIIWKRKHNFMETQNTLKKSAYYSGIALHTGARAQLNMKPAEENTGITFRRIDLPGKPEVKAIAGNVVDVRRGTTIASGDAVVYTVEHVLAALHAFKVDNAIVEMDGMEPPICDGSAQQYVDMIKEVGIEKQNAEAKYISVEVPIIIEEGDTKLIFAPGDAFKITCIVSFGATPLDCQYFSGEINTDSFESEVAPARTFCIFRELEQLLAMGLVKGGSLDNAVVLHDGAIICKDGPRFQNELVRHKSLDIVGDLYLTGRRVKGHVIAVKPGHPINVQLAGRILAQNKL
jgi:UDP-3-O-acyl N-acetylglucosamine deacetylase